MYTHILAITLLTGSLFHLQAATAAPTPKSFIRDIGDAYSGAGGNSAGGSINDHMPANANSLGGSSSILNVFSHNAGNGGNANSGVSNTGKTFVKTASGSSINSGAVGDAYSGAGGSSPGGSIDDAGSGLVNIFSGNAGNGGDAISGSSRG